ncbi:hypothetical protein GPUN_0819 [Glaciecola punicea ACAM 611]|uniref:DUF3307 domain-containing protein n=1 Tax=Glaciecola punicea ACAM 611 TaxID=1121923 RepID=H5T9H7_9ALTE|nr:DUF3307 domain-containing protein [Glaciecola punicea]GAB54954.1 hypothetical protein GPUN_0819 [Glaciecola punicea ACAM 611]
MMLFACLVLAHIVADFYLQPYSWIMDKVKYKIKSVGLLKHMSVHTLLTFTALYVGGVALSSELALALLIIIVTHYMIDIWKTYMGFTTKYFVLDQTGHLLILLGVSLWLSGITFASILSLMQTQFTIGVFAIIIGYLLAYKPLSILIQLLLRPYLQQFEAATQENSGLQTAGEYIGALERFLIITFVLLGQFAAIGFLLAAKSVFRFGDMRRQNDRKLTEYIMLGTLLSFSFALLVGLSIKNLF